MGEGEELNKDGVGGRLGKCEWKSADSSWMGAQSPASEKKNSLLFCSAPCVQRV